ncbi:putative disease resistance protein [Acorus calamus]|uniref:Disease resistance protein n=1 Tax=Acorus calamus TaxID=4465 RepID=A0AAV9CEJ9_ACOCL|nr:putative disease resistance protein [Acorus calamus]
MAEVAYSVVKDLAGLLKDEVHLLSGVREEVEVMERELKRIQVFLKDADSAPHNVRRDERTKHRVEEMRDVAFEAQDVIEDFCILKKQRPATNKHGCFKRCAYRLCTLRTRREIGMKIREINKKIKEIADSTPKFDIKNIKDEGSTSQVREPHGPYPLVLPDEKDIIGLDEQVKEIMGQLTDGDRKRCMISVFGMPGLGKTTLARKVYIRVKASRHFDCFAWITVSNEYNLKKLLKVMAEEIMEKNSAKELLESNFSDSRMASELSEYLKKKKYFIVLDDVWKVEFWERMQNIFPDVNNGSSMLITTRFKDVADFVIPNSPPIQMKFPSAEECLELLVKKAGLEDVSSCPAQLLAPAKQIVERCGRLPLALVVSGGILTTRSQIATEWWKVADKITSELSTTEHICMEVLAISYDDLPIHLKNCFLYIGLYSEDYRINASDLFLHWVAEGFIEATKDETMEEVAQRYLINLIRRSMVQMVEENYIGGIKFCRLHDLMREFAILKAKEIRFLSTEPSADARRLAIWATAEENETVILDQPVSRNLRTLLAFSPDSLLFKHLCDGSPKLKVVQCLDKDIASHDFGRNHLLRYIFMENSHLQNIQQLSNLQTLLVASIRDEDIRQLRNLRYLAVYEECDISANALSEAKDLQTLAGLRAGEWIRSLPSLTNLRRLSILSCTESHKELLAGSLIKLKRLVELVLRGNGGFPSLCTLSSLDHLLGLAIIGTGDSICKLNGPAPKSVEDLPPNLSRLFICGCEPMHYPIEMLGKLPCLRFLQIDEYSYDPSNDYEVWHMKHGDFPHLQVLEMNYVKRLQEWIVDKGALPRLCILRVISCHTLKMLPDGLRHVSTLQELSIRDLTLERRVKRDTGEDWDKIKHVPLIETFNDD